MTLNDSTKVLIELIKKRRTVHSYTEEQVPEELIMLALQNSLWAPNHKLTFPWKFKILNHEQRKTLADSAVKIKKQKEALSEIKENALRAKLESGGSAILFMRKKTSGEPAQLVEEDRATIACSIYIFSLILQSAGYVSKWSTSGYLRKNEFMNDMGINSEDYEIDGMIFCGKPQGSVPHPTDRPDIHSLLI